MTFYRIIFAAVVVLVLGMALCLNANTPIAPDILDRIAINTDENIAHIKYYRMQNLFMRERGYNFIILASLIVGLFIYLKLLSQTGARASFLAHNYRLQYKLEPLKPNIVEFKQRLKRKYMQLSANDCLVAEMLFEGMSTKDIASQLNISVASANTARYRLRKKLNLEHETDLVTFLRTI